MQTSGEGTQAMLKPPARRRSPSSEKFKKDADQSRMLQAPARRRSASFEKPDLPPRTPSKAELRELAERDWRLEVVLATCVAIALGLAIFRDAYIGGLRSSNGRIVSFLASLNGCAGVIVGIDAARNRYHVKLPEQTVSLSLPECLLSPIDRYLKR